jgi:hypothetical protein
MTRLDRDLPRATVRLDLDEDLAFAPFFAVRATDLLRFTAPSERSTVMSEKVIAKARTVDRALSLGSDNIVELPSHAFSLCDRMRVLSVTLQPTSADELICL